MATYRITAPDGTKLKITAPDDATPEQVLAYAQENHKPATPEDKSSIAQNIAGGVLKGASQIGATLLAPVDAAARLVGVQNDYIGRTDRRQAVDDFMKSNGVDTDSFAYGTGKIGTEIAGTAGVGGAVANGLRMIPGVATAAAPLLDAITTGGMRADGVNGLAALATRATGGAINGAASAGLVDPSTAGTGAAVGAAFPVAAQGVAKTANKLGSAMRGNVVPEVKDLYQKAQEMGVQIPADRLVNSRPMNAMAAALNYVPFSGRAATEDAMNSQLNRAVSRTFGQDSSNVTMALRKADAQLGGQFEKTLTENGVKIDKQFLTDMADVFNNAEKELGADALKPIKAKIDQLIEKGADGIIDGKAAYVVKRDLDRIGATNTPQAFHALELKHRLLDALDRSLGPDKAAQFAQTRQMYGNMLDLEKLAKNGAEGELSVARLSNMKNINNQPLQDVADVAAQFVKPREGAHGAAQRAAAGAITFGLGGTPALIAGAGTGRAANMALNSNMLKSIMLNEPVPLVNNKLVQMLQQGGYRAAPIAISGQ